MEYGIKISKKIKTVMFLLAMGILLAFPKDVDANETIAYKNITEKEAQQMLQSINIRACDINKLKKLPIEGLLVSDDWIAIGVQDVINGKSENAVGVFDIKGSLKYAFTFNTTGIHRLFYDNKSDSLILYIPRASTYYTFNESGTLTQIEGYDSKKGVKKTEDRVMDGEGNTYFLSSGTGIRRLFSTDNTIVVKKSIDGSQEVFFQSDYSSYGYALKILPVFLIIMLVLFLEYKYSIFSKK